MGGVSKARLLFVINSGAGNSNIDWHSEISNFFTGKEFDIDFLQLEGKPDVKLIKDRISEFNPGIVVAVGGDGTVGMIAKLVANTERALGILPGGSANGMAKELNIPVLPSTALSILEQGFIKNCDAIRINDHEVAIHLADIGINAQLIKYFDEGALRGKLGYAKMIFKTLWRSQEIEMEIRYANECIQTKAFMVVLANATKYGTGAVINPDGQLDDGKFELVIVRKISFIDILKTLYRPKKVNPDKMQVIQVDEVTITTRHSTYFQVDGEYKGKLKQIKAKILPGYLKVVLPADNANE